MTTNAGLFLEALLADISSVQVLQKEKDDKDIFSEFPMKKHIL